jgi:hypothetical protein
MAKVTLKTGDVLEGRVISVGEPRLAVLRGQEMVEIEASQIDRIEGVEPGLALPRGVERASHYRRVLIDAEASGRVTVRGTVLLIGSDADRMATNRAWDEFLGKETEGEEPPWTWHAEFRVGCKMEVRAFDEFAQELAVIKTDDWTYELDEGRPVTGGVYRMEFEVPMPGEWPTHAQTTLVLSIDDWAEVDEDGVWSFRYTQFASGPTPEIHDCYVRLPVGAEPVESTPEATWFPGRRDAPMCRWKRCVFAGAPFDMAVRYRLR